MKSSKYAILSMDVEDWYHLDYFLNKDTDKNYSMLDGFTNYVNLLNKYNIKTTFFVLSELADLAKDQILYASKCGHEIACHGKTHTRPLLMSVDDFEKEISEAKEKLSDLIGKEVIGYRAPCYSIDNQRYEIIKKLGFKYSSSKMDVPSHPLYGELKLDGFTQPIPGVYKKDGMTEFALSTKKFAGSHIAVSGGGWIRLFPWSTFMKPMINAYLNESRVYTLYIHPFELSKRAMPKVSETPLLTNIRSRRGLGRVDEKIEQLIVMLDENGFKYKTFAEMMEVTNE